MPHSTRVQTLDLNSATPGWELPIADADVALYSIVRAACQRAGFAERNVCTRFALTSIADFRSRREGRPEARRVQDALEVLTDLFMDLAGVSETHARQVLGDPAVDAMLHLRLVVEDGGREPELLATMLMYPVADVLLISDRTFGRPGEQRGLPDDIVYPAVTRNTTTFLRMLPSSPCDDFLEMCAGNGVAAIAKATQAGHAWSLDLTARATRVATFNARLNGLTNVTVLQGDLFAPVEGRQFDRIVAHPPYVPSAEQAIIYRDGGADGEMITKRIVSDLPRFLRPGGRFFCTCIATDRTDAPLERRLHEWLADAQQEFDVVVAVTSAEHPSEYYFKSAINGGTTFAQAERQHHAFKAMTVERLVYSSFVIERHAAPRTSVCVRVSRGPRTTGRELEQYCDWLARREATDLQQQMLAAYPRLDPGASLQERRQVVDQKWKVTDTALDTAWPFSASIQCPDDVAQLLARCDGTRTVQQVITSLRQKGFLKSSVRDEIILQILMSCVAAGALHLEDASRRST